MVKQDAKDAAFGARLFYNGLMLFSLAIILYYDNDLQKAILSLDFPYFISYFVIYGLSYYLFYTCGRTPGFLDIDRPDDQRIELSMTTVKQQEGSESLLPFGNESPSAINNGLEKTTSQEDSHETIESLKIDSFEKKKTDTTDNGLPELRYCEDCRMLQPYRTKHCDKCERCVRKFDHHCFWIGGCVGELNHRTFWLFLLVQTILEGWTWIIASSGQSASYAKAYEDLKNSDSDVNSAYTTSEYGAFTIIIVVATLAILFTASLLGFHTFLVLTNQTTWEYSKKERITYLAIYPRGFYPFNRGVLDNFKTIFLHKYKFRIWELPPVYYESQKKRGFNWCENEYWECC